MPSGSGGIGPGPRRRIEAIARGDPRYPAGLNDLSRPPETIWVEGDPTLLHVRSIAVVGTRRMTGYGDRVAREIAAALGRAGVCVLSGLAQGIDNAAHEAALDAGGPSVAVLGEGLRVVTASGRRRSTFARLRERGCLLSEFPPFTAGLPWMFAQRDATIAALAEAVIVVEAPHGSGALITARHALRLGRALYAVPGPLGAAASEGANALIADGRARALLGPETLSLPSSPAPVTAAPDPVLELLAAGPLTPDALGAERALLAELLLAGRIVMLPDGRVARA